MTRLINGVVIVLVLCAAAEGQETPTEVLASLRVGNGTGSATTIIKGPSRSYHLSCHHVFGTVDGEVLLETVAGDKVHARCIATDPKLDLCLLRSYSDGIVTEVDLAGEIDAKRANWTSCGFPAGIGPNRTALTFLGEAQGCGHWRFRVNAGTYLPGVSGGGLYADGKLCGVTSAIESHGEPHTINREQVLTFLVRNRDKFIDPSCPNGMCPKSPSKPWLQPNVPIVVPPLPPQPPVVLPDAEGKRDNSVLKDSAASARILDLEKRVAALEALVLKKVPGGDELPLPPLEKDAPPAAVPGPKGDKGDRGDAGLPPTREQIESAVSAWVRDNLDKIKGRDGKNGTVNVLVKKPDGKTDTHSGLTSGNVIVDVAEIVKKK